VDPSTWYADVDGDGYGDPAVTAAACEPPTGYGADAADCDDADAGVYPGATEHCDGVDEDCDGVADDGAVDPSTWYADADGDGYGDAAATATACEPPSGYGTDANDCDDADAGVYPGAAETCDGADEDCDGTVDEGLLGSGPACPAASCEEILLADPTAADGTYWILAGGAATELLCDMASGGWTLVFGDDFEASVDPGWSLTSTYACGGWGTLLGGYGIISGGSFGITIDCLGIPHAEAWVELGYAALDSWDGETGYVYVDGTAIWALAINNHSTSLSEVCGWDRGYYGSYDSAHAVSVAFAHGNGTLALTAGSTLDQSATDESFGLTEVWVWVR
jgi:hypothetical protein